MAKNSILKGDRIIWIIVLILSMISIVAIYSSSSILANRSGDSKIDICIKEMIYMACGLVLLFITSLLPLKVFKKTSFFVYVFSLVLVTIALVGLIIAKIKGTAITNRGINIAGHYVNVLELAKLGVIMYLALALEAGEGKIKTFKKYFVNILLPIIIPCLIIIPNSFSSTVIIASSALMVLFLMKINGRYLIYTFLIAIGSLALMIGIYSINPEKMDKVPIFNRFSTLFNRTERMSDKESSYDINKKRQEANAAITVSQGGILGKGPGKSTQRFSLSQAYDDYIFAFIVEEYGLIGGIFVILLYLILFFRCIALSTRCSRPYSSVMVVGLGFMITFQAMLHIFVSVGIFPVTGQTLPFVSKGGFAYIVYCIAFGMILSISRQLDKQDDIIKEERKAILEQEENEFEDE